MILYGNKLSTYTARVRVALCFKEIAFEEREPPDGYRSAAYRRIVSMGSIPALVDGDFVLSESEAIVEYLEDIKKIPPLLPDAASARAQARALSRVHDSWIEPRLRATYPYLARLRALSTDESRALDAIVADLKDRLARFDATIDPAPFAAGSHISVADCAWPTTLCQIELVMEHLGQTFHYSNKIERWREQLHQHPAFAPSVSAVRGAMRDWLDGR